MFILIGLQLRDILARLEQHDLWHLAGLGLAISTTLIISRFLWLFPATWLPRVLSPSLRECDPVPSWSHVAVLSWAGMRGVVSLAAALALPAEFPGRDIILFLVFCAILATLVLQGTTLGPLIRHLGVSEPEDEPANPVVTPEAITARSEATVAAMGAVAQKLDDPEQADVAEDLLRDLRVRAKQADQMRRDAETGLQRDAARLGLRLNAIEAARAKLLSEHKDELDTEAKATLIAESGLEEQQIRAAMGER